MRDARSKRSAEDSESGERGFGVSGGTVERYSRRSSRRVEKESGVEVQQVSGRREERVEMDGEVRRSG